MSAAWAAVIVASVTGFNALVLALVTLWLAYHGPVEVRRVRSVRRLVVCELLFKEIVSKNELDRPKFRDVNEALIITRRLRSRSTEWLTDGIAGGVDQMWRMYADDQELL